MSISLTLSLIPQKGSSVLTNHPYRLKFELKPFGYNQKKGISLKPRVYLRRSEFLNRSKLLNLRGLLYIIVGSPSS